MCARGGTALGTGARRDCHMGTRVAEMRTDKLCPGREKANHVLMAWLHVPHIRSHMTWQRVPQVRSHREPRQTHGHAVKQGKTDTDTHSPQTRGLTGGARGC